MSEPSTNSFAYSSLKPIQHFDGRKLFEAHDKRALRRCLLVNYKNKEKLNHELEFLNIVHSSPAAIKLHEQYNYENQAYLSLSYIHGKSIESIVLGKKQSIKKKLNLSIFLDHFYHCCNLVKKVHHQQALCLNLYSNNFFITESKKIIIRDWHFSKKINQCQSSEADHYFKQVFKQLSDTQPYKNILKADPYQPEFDLLILSMTMKTYLDIIPHSALETPVYHRLLNVLHKMNYFECQSPYATIEEVIDDLDQFKLGFTMSFENKLNKQFVVYLIIKYKIWFLGIAFLLSCTFGTGLILSLDSYHNYKLKKLIQKNIQVDQGLLTDINHLFDHNFEFSADVLVSTTQTELAKNLLISKKIAKGNLTFHENRLLALIHLSLLEIDKATPIFQELTMIERAKALKKFTKTPYEHSVDDWKSMVRTVFVILNDMNWHIKFPIFIKIKEKGFTFKDKLEILSGLNQNLSKSLEEASTPSKKGFFIINQSKLEYFEHALVLDIDEWILSKNPKIDDNYLCKIISRSDTKKITYRSSEDLIINDYTSKHLINIDAQGSGLSGITSKAIQNSLEILNISGAKNFKSWQLKKLKKLKKLYLSPDDPIYQKNYLINDLKKHGIEIILVKI